MLRLPVEISIYAAGTWRQRIALRRTVLEAAGACSVYTLRGGWDGRFERSQRIEVLLADLDTVRTVVEATRRWQATTSEDAVLVTIRDASGRYGYVSLTQG